MYIHRMKRTQIYLTEEEDEILRRESDRTGKSKAALIREAIDRMFGGDEERDVREFRRALKASHGAWRDVSDEELEGLRRLRDWSDRQRELLDFDDG